MPQSNDMFRPFLARVARPEAWVKAYLHLLIFALDGSPRVGTSVYKSTFKRSPRVPARRSMVRSLSHGKDECHENPDEMYTHWFLPMGANPVGPDIQDCQAYGAIFDCFQYFPHFGICLMCIYTLYPALPAHSLMGLAYLPASPLPCCLALWPVCQRWWTASASYTWHGPRYTHVHALETQPLCLHHVSCAMFCVLVYGGARQKTCGFSHGWLCGGMGVRACMVGAVVGVVSVVGVVGIAGGD